MSCHFQNQSRLIGFYLLSFTKDFSQITSSSVQSVIFFYIEILNVDFNGLATSLYFSDCAAELVLAVTPSHNASQSKDSHICLFVTRTKGFFPVHLCQQITLLIRFQAATANARHSNRDPDDVLFNSVYGVRTIELNRPKKLNSLNSSMVNKIIPRLLV